MKKPSYELFEPVIGLEIHVQLNTKTKLFSSALNHFGDEPNTNITDICTAQPGALPLLNEEAVKKTILFGIAVKGKIAKRSLFERKSYFYPDTPRNFQITQRDYPIISDGVITAIDGGVKKEFLIDRIHLEDDAGMLKHFSSFAGIDFNRAGVPLIEVVSTPTIHSPKEAVLYASAVRALAQYLDISDGNMEEGSLRIDANVSVRPYGEISLRNKTEIKNLNSFHFLHMALEAEVARQIAIYVENPEGDINELIVPATYRWDAISKKTIFMRRKETIEDYRYFPEPDLMPLIITEEYIEKLKINLPELPYERFKRYVETYGLSHQSAHTLVSDKSIADYFEKAVQKCLNPKAACYWITMEFMGRIKEKGLSYKELAIPAEHITKLVNLIERGAITGKLAKLMADEMILHPDVDPETLLNNNLKYCPIEDMEITEQIVDKVLLENAKSVEDYRKGVKKAFDFLVGQVMHLSFGRADVKVVRDILHKKLLGENGAI
jgi:aspartyl-tRNA(Asn)/glutamyl-tRNA(Gln) amidotransferase subunit B